MNKLLSSSKNIKRIIPLHYRVLGRALNFLSYINNELAASMLSKLWFTVFKSKAKPWVLKFWQTADSRLEIKVNDKIITVHIWGHGPLIVMMHGWSGSGTQFRKFIPSLINAGYRIALFDAPSHGINPGKKSHLIEFSDTLIVIQKKLGDINTVISHSFGSMATVVAMQRELAAKKMILIAPHLDANEMHITYSELLNLNPRLSNRFRDLIELKMKSILKIEEIWGYLSPKKLLSHNSYKGLLIYDLNDEEIPQKQFKEIERYWKNSTVITTTDLGHHRILKDKNIINEVVNYIGKTSE